MNSLAHDSLHASLGYITEVELLYQRTCTILANIIAQLAPKEASIIVPTTAFLSLPTQDIIKLFNFTKWDFFKWYFTVIFNFHSRFLVDLSIFAFFLSFFA